MLLVVLERDRAEIEVGGFKFKEPYLKIIEQAEKRVKEKLKQTNIRFHSDNMKLIKVGSDGDFTEYQFVYGRHQENRRYLNIRLRNRTEELMSEYLASDLHAQNL